MISKQITATSTRRPPPRSKSKRIIIDLSDDYEEQAALLRTKSYTSYDEAKKAIDGWQELAGQLTYVINEEFPGKRPKRRSQPDAGTIVCNSTAECTFKCKIEVQADKKYRIFLTDTSHTCRSGAIPAEAEDQDPEPPESKIPQALKKHLTSHNTPNKAKRIQSINVWRKDVATSSSPSGPLPVQTSGADPPNLHQTAKGEEPMLETLKSKALSGLRESMKPRASIPNDHNRAKPAETAAAHPNTNEMRESESQKEVLVLKTEAAQKDTPPQLPPVALTKSTTAVRTKTKLDRNVATTGVAVRLAGLHNIPANDRDYKRSVDATPASGQQAPAPPPAPRKHKARPPAAVPQPTSSAANTTIPVAAVKRPDLLPPGPLPLAQPAGLPAERVAAVATKIKASSPPKLSGKRTVDAIEIDCDKQAAPVNDKLLSPKRQRIARPEAVFLADKKYGLDPRLVEFLAIAGIHKLSDILNLGMVESDMDAFLSGVYARMEEFAGADKMDAGRVRAAVKNCAEGITIAKVKGLFHI